LQDTEPRVGSLIAGRYQLIRQLGGGGFGTVWLARDGELDVEVAVKQVSMPHAASPAERQERLLRAQREARNTAKLRDHPNVVTVYDAVIHGGSPWAVMQFVKGWSLQEHLDKHGPLSVDLTEKVAEALLSALGAAHELGIIHRDVKPANVMLAEDGSVLLTDFGISVAAADTALTASGTVIGSMEYIAPERARGEAGKAASDLFSLGATLYHAVEGVSPFRREESVGALTAVLFEEPAPPAKAGRLTALITRLLAKDPERRLAVDEARALLGGRLDGVAPTMAAKTMTAQAVPPIEAQPTEAAAPQYVAIRPVPTPAYGAVTSIRTKGAGQNWLPRLAGPIIVLVLLVPAIGKSFRMDPKGGDINDGVVVDSLRMFTFHDRANAYVGLYKTSPYPFFNVLAMAGITLSLILGIALTSRTPTAVRVFGYIASSAAIIGLAWMCHALLTRPHVALSPQATPDPTYGSQTWNVHPEMGWYLLWSAFIVAALTFVLRDLATRRLATTS
jgi:hypothetical protein